jgi:hypothetical protein
MTRARDILRAKRAAAVAARYAAENGEQDHPWSLPNVRVWQNVMCRHLDRYHALLRQYLKERAQR